MTHERDSLKYLSAEKQPWSNLKRVVFLVLICGITSLTVGCGAANSAQSVPAAGTQIRVSPASVTLSPGARQQFTATVMGTSNTAVVWMASAGSISNNGTFVAPTSSTSPITITATSLADRAQRGSSTVAVQAGAQPLAGAQLQIKTASLSGTVVDANYSATLEASGGTPPYEWSISAGSLPLGMGLQPTTGDITGSASQPGTYSFTVLVTDAAFHSTTQTLPLTVSASSGTKGLAGSGAFDGPAELPRVYLSTTLADTPAPGPTINVAAGGNLQNALNSASCGDTIALQAGATFTGLYKFPAKTCDDAHWIIVRTSAPDSSLPAEGARLTPCYAGVASLPGRPAFACTSTKKVVATISYPGTGDGPVYFDSGANHYRLLGLEITRVANNHIPVGDLVSVPMGSLMDSIVIDRSYIHGTPLDETRRGVALVGSSLAVQDSYISDIHCNVSGSCVEAQAVAGAAPGPYKITDNFLEASAQSILFGGGIATQTPADIEISRNHMFKPLIWLKGQPGFLIETIVKNHVELKNAQRVLIDSNIMDNTWGGFSQFGFSVVITPKNQDLDGVSECPLCFVSDITVRYATISHVVSLFEIANGMTPAGGVAVAGERYSIHDVIGDDITGVFAQVSTVSRPLLNNVMINHVTAFPPQMMLNVGGPLTSPMPGFTLTNSILNAGQYPIWSTGYDGKSGCAFYDVPTTTMSACFANPVFSSNAILASPYAVSKWPKGNFFYTSSSIDFVNYNKGKGGDYHLQPTSPAVGAASDGSNLGANVDEVLTAISGVE